MNHGRQTKAAPTAIAAIARIACIRCAGEILHTATTGHANNSHTHCGFVKSAMPQRRPRSADCFQLRAAWKCGGVSTAKAPIKAPVSNDSHSGRTRYGWKMAPEAAASRHGI